MSFFIGALLTFSQAFADKPPWAGGGKGREHEWRQPHQGREWEGDERTHQYREYPQIREGGYFIDRHRAIVHDYYAEQFRLGHCPPGLAKKHNGCLPPGQARKWAIGQPLPAGVPVYDLPYPIAVQLGMPPAGYRYVRVANDILLIATGSMMVMDAIMDLGGR